ncbi:methyltransferase domain-containing protein [Lentzea sp. NPDC058436]|uniref:methyltransferase domain-containing protein n=1 Tax=Lentzea sp. NPDC058436 TaxID=3346499 RepID=UPI00365E5A2F
MTDEVRDFWDRHAATFDEEPDRGLLDPGVRAAWAGLLLPLMPGAAASVTDLGCGTGSLSVLLAQAGHSVRGLDLSERMVAAARAKARAAEFVRGDASQPSCTQASSVLAPARVVGAA